MKALYLSALAALASLPGTVRAELDFTLQHQTRTADAITVSQPYIMDGASKIFLSFPGNWHAVDGAQKLELTPNVPNASVRLENHHGPALTIDAAGGQKLLERLLAQVPKEAKNVAADPVEINPFPILWWTNVQVTVRYELHDQTFRRSTMYVDMRPGRIVEFSVTSLDGDYEKLYRPARGVLASFFEPSKDLPPDLAKKYEEGNVE